MLEILGETPAGLSPDEVEADDPLRLPKEHAGGDGGGEGGGGGRAESEAAAAEAEEATAAAEGSTVGSTAASDAYIATPTYEKVVGMEGRRIAT